MAMWRSLSLRWNISLYRCPRFLGRMADNDAPACCWLRSIASVRLASVSWADLQPTVHCQLARSMVPSECTRPVDARPHRQAIFRPPCSYICSLACCHAPFPGFQSRPCRSRSAGANLWHHDKLHWDFGGLWHDENVRAQYPLPVLSILTLDAALFCNSLRVRSSALLSHSG